MLAVERPSTVGFDSLSRSLKGNINDFMYSGKFKATPAINRELKHIETGVDHIRLDNDFMKSSNGWAVRFDPNTTVMEQKGAQAAINKATGIVNSTKTQNNTRTLQGMMDNQARQNHQTTVNSLRGAQRDLEPFAHQSIDRVRQYCDYMGVTDRYTGYRHNLNRGNRDPVRLGYSWLDSNQNTQDVPMNTSQRLAASAPASQGRSQQYAAQPSYGYFKTTRPEMTGLVDEAQMHRNRLHRPPITASIQEQCGINTNFPGKTEYMIRYTSPEKSPSVGFQINPQPDMSKIGRPLCKQAFYPKASEYQTRYEWPDGSKIEKLPWLRK